MLSVLYVAILDNPWDPVVTFSRLASHYENVARIKSDRNWLCLLSLTSNYKNAAEAKRKTVDRTILILLCVIEVSSH